MPVAVVVRVHGHRRVAQDRLRARRCHRDAAATLQRVVEVVQVPLLFFALHFQVADGCLQARRPVDQALPAIDQPLLPQRHECFAHRARKPLVQREALAIPIAACPQSPQLLDNPPAVLALPLPRAAQKLLAAHFLAAAALLAQHVLDLKLRGNARVVGAGHPQRRPPAHPLVADHQVFQADEHGVAVVQRAGHVGRRNADHERLGVRMHLRFEPAVLFPPAVEPRLGLGEIERLGHFCGHSVLVCTPGDYRSSEWGARENRTAFGSDARQRPTTPAPFSVAISDTVDHPLSLLSYMPNRHAGPLTPA